MDYVVFVSLSSPFIFKILTTPKPQIFQFPTVLRPFNIPPIFTLYELSKNYPQNSHTFIEPMTTTLWSHFFSFKAALE